MRIASWIRAAIYTAISFLPAVARALDYYPSPDNTSHVDFLVYRGKNTLNSIVGVLFVLATVIFLWGVIQFIVKAGDEQGRTKAKGIMTWGIIGLVVMAAIWGIVNTIAIYFVGTGGIKSPIPKAPGTGGY